MNSRKLRVESLEQRAMLAVTAGIFEAAGAPPAPTASGGPVDACIAVTAAVPTATEVSSVTTLNQVNVGDTFYVSVYVKSTDPAHGILGGYCSLYYDSSAFTAGSYVESPIFSELTINDGYNYSANGYISAFGGYPVSITDAYGETSWALVGTQAFTANTAGNYQFRTGTPRKDGVEKADMGFTRDDFWATDAYGNPVSTLSLEVTASGTTPPITNISLSDWTGDYDGNAHSITVSDPDAATDTIRYSTDGVNYTLTANPSYTNPGTYKTYVKVSRNGYQDWFGSADVTISALKILTGERGYYVSYGANRHYLQWTAVPNASGYELQYSTDGSNWSVINTAGTDALVTNLTYGDDVTYRVRPQGTGTSADSLWSVSKTFKVCPMDINNDGDISAADRALLTKSWLSEKLDSDYRHYCDINADGDVTGRDRAFLSDNWLKEADDANLLYPGAVAADMLFAEFASADLSTDLDVF